MVEAGKWYYLKENVTGADDDGCRVRMDVCGDGLNFCFEVADTATVSRFRHDNEDIWQDDAVEVFVSPDGDRKKYLELEVSPYGVRFFGEVCNEDGKTPKLKKVDPMFSASAAETEGGYRVTIRIPYSSMKGYDAKKCVLNAFRLDKKADGIQLLYALNPTLCESFHRPAYFV